MNLLSPKISVSIHFIMLVLFSPVFTHAQGTLTDYQRADSLRSMVNGYAIAQQKTYNGSKAHINFGIAPLRQREKNCIVLLKTGWKMMEVFSAKARIGKTELISYFNNSTMIEGL